MRRTDFRKRTEDGRQEPLVLTVVSPAAAGMARPLRVLVLPLGAALLVMPSLDAGIAETLNGLSLIAPSLRHGPIRGSSGIRSRLIIRPSG